MKRALQERGGGKRGKRGGLDGIESFPRGCNFSAGIRKAGKGSQVWSWRTEESAFVLIWKKHGKKKRKKKRGKKLFKVKGSFGRLICLCVCVYIYSYMLPGYILRYSSITYNTVLLFEIPYCARCLPIQPC